MPDFENESRVKLRWFIEHFPSPHPFFKAAMAALERKEAEDDLRNAHQSTIHIQNSNVANLNLGTQSGTSTAQATGQDLARGPSDPTVGMNQSARMLPWIVSVAVVVCIIAYTYSCNATSHRATYTPPVSSDPMLLESPDSKPTPLEIRQQIQSLPPYQQDAARESYKGLKVRWKVSLEGVDKMMTGGGEVYWLVILKYHGSKELADAMLSCSHFDLESSPRLKSAKSGEMVIVEGTIKGVQGLDISLSDATIHFR